MWDKAKKDRIYYKLLQLNTMQRFMLAGFLCLGMLAASSKIKLPCDELGKTFVTMIDNRFLFYISYFEVS